jgi:hypothetical protein
MNAPWKTHWQEQKYERAMENSLAGTNFLVFGGIADCGALPDGALLCAAAGYGLNTNSIRIERPLKTYIIVPVILRFMVGSSCSCIWNIP